MRDDNVKRHGTVTLLCLAAATALLLVSAASASAAINAHVTIAGSGSGRVFGTGVTPGNPAVNCHKPSQVGDVCDTETQAAGPFKAVKVGHEAPPGSVFKEWKVEEGNPIGCAQGDPGAGDCSVTISGGEIKIKAVFEAEVLPKHPLTVKKTGTGDGTVTSSPAGLECAAGCKEETAEFTEGEKVTLEATPDGSSTFAGWSGCEAEPEGKCEVTMSAAKEVEAEFDAEAGPVFHTLTITVTGNGSVSANEGQISDCTSAGGPSCEGEYPDGTHVTLTETPGAHSAFNGWQTLQCDESTATTCEVVLSGDEAVAAGFIDTATLTVATEGSGSGTVTSSPGLISCSPFCADEIAKGAKVTLTATPAPGSAFYSWKGCDKGGVNGRQCTVAMDKAKTVTAVFSSTHALTLAKAGSGSGKVQSSPGGILCLASCQATSASFLATATVKLTPTPAKHVAFTEWLGDCTGSGPCELSMGEDHQVEAKFTEVPKEPLALTKTGGGTGTVKSDPSGINCGATCSSSTAAYYQGDLVTLTATPAKGSAFGGWSGGGCSGTGSCEVTIAEAEEVQAEFR